MKAPRLRAVTATSIAVALLTGSMAFAAAKPDSQAKGTLEQRRTIDDLRAVGRAMYDWYVAEMKPRSTGHRKSAAEIDAGTTRNLDAVPAISAAELERVLVPKYIAAIPRADGWGHPYEFRLNTQDPNADYVMAIRSAGADGKFAASLYTIGAFDDRLENEDVVWSDGYFVRWPEAR
jgi:hypothetical protein